jgi:small-conductance mechanosensitive channel/CRP-like cAMP-binding protein
VKSLIVKAILFCIAVAAAWHSDHLLAAMNLAGEDAWRRTWRLTLETVAWLAGASVTIAAVNLLFWDGYIARIARRPVPGLLKGALATIIFLLTVTGIVGLVFGLDVTAIWATSGVVGLVLGFALRGIIEDVFTGIAMSVDGAIKAGDWVALHNVNFGGTLYGRVLEIAWRTSRVQLENNNIVVVPNSMMGTIAVTNFSYSDHKSRLETEIVIDFEVPPERARRILLAGARSAVASGAILPEPAPAVVIGEATERGVIYKVRYWGNVYSESPSKMQDAVMSQLLRHLRIAGLTPALPKEDVFMDQRPKRLLLHESLEDRIEVLSRIALFHRALEPDELEQLAVGIQITMHDPGQVLVRQGTTGDSMYVVVEGLLDVVVDKDDGSGPLHVNHVSAGDIFGEMCLLTGEPRSASVVAVTSTVLYEIRRAHFESLIVTRPAIADKLSTLVAHHRIHTDAAMANATQHEVAQRSRRLKEQILERMRSVFGALLHGPG